MERSKKIRLLKAKFLLLFILFLATKSSFSQQNNISQHLLHGGWNAHWISCPGVSAKAYGVYHFRKKIDLPKVPSKFIIHVSADNRYQLFVNGNLIGRGPARSSRYNWNFGTYDIAGYLKTGKNIIAALVWNMAEFAPVAQISEQTGFLLQGDSTSEEILNTNTSWKVLHDTAYAPCAINMGAVLQSYVVVGPGDEVHAKDYPWGWENSDYNDDNWQAAKILYTPVVLSGFGSDNIWTLAPRMIPQMEEKMQRMDAVRRVEGIKINS